MLGVKLNILSNRLNINYRDKKSARSKLGLFQERISYTHILYKPNLSI